MNRHKRKLNKRRRKSNWSIRRARLRLWANRRPPPANAHVALAIPNADDAPENNVSRGFSRMVTVTALSSVVILALAIAYLLQFQPDPTDPAQPEIAGNLTEQAGQPGAEPVLEPTETLLPTLEPTATPAPTATPIIIELTPQEAIDPLAGGGSVVFALHKNGNSDLYALAVGQDGLTRLTNDDALDEAPAWSPSGRQIAFVSRRSGNDDIYILDLQSGEVSQMTTQIGYDGNPSWSPDGEWLVYESYQGENLDIYILRVDLSQDPIRITENPGPDRAPNWSPDGREIVWSGMRDNNFELWLMSLDTVGDSQALNLTNTADIDENAPKFDFDSQRIAWHGRTKADNRNQVRIGRLDENRQLENSTLVGEGSSPAWSPAGDTLIWSSETAEAGVLQIGAIKSFGIVPQSYLQDGSVGKADWAGVNLASEPAGWLTSIDQAPQLTLFTETIEEPPPAEPTEALTDQQENEGNEGVEAEGDESIETADSTAERAPEVPNIQLRRVLPSAELGLLSDSVDQSFLALRSRVEFETGIDVLGDIERMFVPLNAAQQPGESAELWHRAGRAFDINNELALGFSPIFEVVRRDERDQTFWDVYVRTAAQDGTQGRPMADIPWDFRSRFGDNPVDYDEGGRLKDGIPSGYYVNLTALARDYGWESVPAERNWRTFYPGVRFWQFEKRGNLTWEEAMLEIYTPDELGGQ